MPAPGFETLLVIAGVGVPPYSGRGITETLAPIDEAENVVRTVNGGTLNLSPPQMQKYAITIEGEDINAPALGGVWPGTELVIDCISELAYPTGGTPERTVVTGSSRTDGTHTFYRPQLTVKLTHFESETDEWGLVVSWTLEAVEA